jgi:uncharacterized membrane protein
MDPDALQDEVDTWVRDGIITESQAEEILERYDDSAGGRSRVVIALSVVGSALVFVGLTLFLATNWETLPTAAQVAVLLGGPGLAYAGGVAGYRRSLPRIGLACCLLGAVLAGPSLFLLADLASVTVADTWLLLAWTAIALPTGHALGSRAGVGIGITVLTGVAVSLAEPATPIPVIACLGIALFALGTLQNERIEWSYRIGGVTLALAGLLLLTTLDGRYERFDIGPTPVLVATVLGSLAGAGWLFVDDDRYGAQWATTAIVAVGASVIVVLLTPEYLPDLVAFLGSHVSMLVAVATTGYFGYRSGARRFIDLATLAALAQTLSFVASTVIDSLSGSLALVAAGVILLTAGVALERGRRTLLTRLGG